MMSMQFVRQAQRRGTSANADAGASPPETRTSELQRLAQSALTNNPVFSLRELAVESRDNAIFISGSVTSFYHKQLAQEAVRAVAGALNVVNAVHVEVRSSTVN
ncbi:MAG TPA: BON domain-containing protein [Pirellulales bacterium]|jgi:osmotically-inducible protein OsmY|nr:BON domain-containing protein [Pirellulales bacterium]